MNDPMKPVSDLSPLNSINLSKPKNADKPLAPPPQKVPQTNQTSVDLSLHREDTPYKQQANLSYKSAILYSKTEEVSLQFSVAKSFVHSLKAIAENEQKDIEQEKELKKKLSQDLESVGRVFKEENIDFKTQARPVKNDQKSSEKEDETSLPSQKTEKPKEPTIVKATQEEVRYTAKVDGTVVPNKRELADPERQEIHQEEMNQNDEIKPRKKTSHERNVPKEPQTKESHSLEDFMNKIRKNHDLNKKEDPALKETKSLPTEKRFRPTENESEEVDLKDYLNQIQQTEEEVMEAGRSVHEIIAKVLHKASKKEAPKITKDEEMGHEYKEILNDLENGHAKIMKVREKMSTRETNYHKPQEFNIDQEPVVTPEEAIQIAEELGRTVNPALLQAQVPLPPEAVIQLLL